MWALASNGQSFGFHHMPKKIPSSLSPESSFEKRVVVITTAGCHQSLPEGWLHMVLGSWGVLGKH